MKQKFRFAYPLTLLILLLATACSTDNGYQVVSSGRPGAPSARLISPNNIQVLSIDGVKTTGLLGGAMSNLTGGLQKLELATGPHRVMAKYEAAWAQKNTRVDEQIKVITSWPVLLNFTAQPGQTYRLALEEPQDLQSAEAFAVNPKIWIQEDLTGERVASSVTLREARERSLASRKSPTLPQNTGGLAPLDLLKFWWQQADEVERQHFQEWLQQQAQ